MSITTFEVFSEALEQFQEFERVAKPVQRLVEAHAAAVLATHRHRIDRIESRTKSFDSIRDNYIRDYGLPSTSVTLDEFLRDANDLVGVRVVVYYNDDADAICNEILKIFPDGKIDQKLTIHDANRGSRFGYRAVHVNFSFSSEPILRSTRRSQIGIEFQIRTILSDAWARHSHKLVYKNDNVLSDEIIRSFARNAAVVEEVDENMERIHLMPLVAPRTSLSLGLTWHAIYEESCRNLNASLDEADLRALYLQVKDTFVSKDEGEVLGEFLADIRLAWDRFGCLDFDRYGYPDPAAKLRMSLYGLNQNRYESLIPLHMRNRIGNLLHVGIKRSNNSKNLGLRLIEQDTAVPFTVPDDIKKLCEDMVKDWRYFVIDSSARKLVPVEQILLTRARPSGIRNAVERMKEAASGAIPRRGPIQVLKKDDGYVVIDGNSTVVVLAAIGLEEIPVEVQSSAVASLV